MSYKWVRANAIVQRLADGAFIPNDGGNVDWQAFQAWVAAGNTPQPEAPPPPEDERDAAIRTRTIGTVTPKTVAEVKAMTLAEYDAWFDANFDTAARAIGLLKRIVLLLVRRVF